MSHENNYWAEPIPAFDMVNRTMRELVHELMQFPKLAAGLGSNNAFKTNSTYELSKPLLNLLLKLLKKLSPESQDPVMPPGASAFWNRSLAVIRNAIKLDAKVVKAAIDAAALDEYTAAQFTWYLKTEMDRPPAGGGRMRSRSRSVRRVRATRRGLRRVRATRRR